jgi:hypothetical protein
MLKYLSPTLLSLIIGAAGMTPLWSATVEERDQSAIALSKLINAKMRLLADRQLKEFKEAGYPASDPHLDKVLRAIYLDQFRNELPEANKAKNEEELKALRTELDPALKTNKLSVISKLLFSGGGGSSTRMVNEIARIMHPEAPGPLVTMAAEKGQVLTRLMDALGKQAEEDFNAALEKMKPGLAEEAAGLEKPDNDPLYKKAVEVGVKNRLEALAPLSVAMIALRDGVNRGREFGLDPAPIQAQLTKMFTTVHPEFDKKSWADILGIWSFEWGEYNPFINLHCATLLGDAVLAGSKVAKDDDVESMLMTVANFSTKEFKDANMKAEAYRLKFMGWTSLLRYRLMQNNNRSFNKGTASWQEFLKLAKQDDMMRLSTVPKAIAGDLGKVYIFAARLLQAKGDSNSASGLMADLSGAKPANPYGHYAKSWITYWNQMRNNKGGGSVWPQHPSAMEPEKALLLARAFMSEAFATTDSAAQRAIYLGAAVALRNGLLGLNSGLVDEKGYLEFAPQIYQLYAYVLNRMELRHQAVIIAQDGARTLSAKMKWYADQKKPNPWKKTNAEGKLVWDDSPTRVTPYRVANEGLIFASALKSRDPNTQSLYGQSIELLKSIDPDAVGENLRLGGLYVMLQEGDYDGVMRESEAILREYPASYLKVFSIKSAAITKLIDKLTKAGDKAKLAQVTEQMVKDNQAMGKRIEDELNAKPADGRRRELESAKTTIKISEVENLLANGKFEDVIARLDAKAFANLPAEETLAARMVHQLCKATFDWHESRKEVLGKDPVALLAAMKTYEKIYANVSRGLGKLRNKNVDGSLDNSSRYLAKVFTGSSTLIQRLLQTNPSASELSAMVSVANRAFADLFEPTIDKNTPTANILFIARTLWEVDEKARAAKQFMKYMELISGDAETTAFRADPKSIVDKYGAVITARGEFRKPWEEIADLSWDSPEDKQAYETLPKANWPTRLRKDYAKALTKITDLRKIMETNKGIIAPAQFKEIQDAVDNFQKIIYGMNSYFLAMARVATYYRESDQFGLAQPLLDTLYKEDPLDPDNQMALVLVTYHAALNGNPMPAKAELDKARRIAAGVRDGSRGTTNKIGYWEAYTLVMEFSIMLGEPKSVNDTLSFLRRDRSDITRDLIGPPVWGDDKRIRRPMNALSIQLVHRFLSLYEKQGITEKPAFKIVDIEINGETKGFFTDSDAPTFVAKPMTTPDDDDVIALVASDGSTPAPTKPLPPKPAEAREEPETKPGTKPAKPAATTPATPAAEPAATTPAATPTATPAATPATNAP